jgi:hypothetical protein
MFKYNLCTLGYLSMQQSGSANINYSILPSLLIPTLPKVSPSIYEKNGEKGILDWKIPQHLPTPAILPFSKEDISLPTTSDIPQLEKQAARMIVIRRRKMKKHKLKKLRKVRKFEYRRMALKRKTKKEKEFQMQLSAQVKEAEKFDAKSYVEGIIRIAKEDLTVKRKPHPTHKKNPCLHDEDGKRIMFNQHMYGRK